MASDLIDPAHQSRDLRTVRAAVKKGWNIPDEVFEQLPTIIWGIAKNDTESTKDRVAAAKLLDTMKDRNEKLGRGRKRQPAPSNPTVIFMEGNVDDAKRQLLERANRICADSAGAGSNPPGTVGAGESGVE